MWIKPSPSSELRVSIFSKRVCLLANKLDVLVSMFRCQRVIFMKWIKARRKLINDDEVEV